MPELQQERPRRRLDAVAITSLIMAAMVSLAMITYPPLTGAESAFGPFVDSAIAPVALALGYASLPLLAAWFAITILYVRRAGIARILVNALGWLILLGVSASLLDRWAAVPLRSFGRGGSLGAYLSFILADRFSPFVIGILLGGVTLFAFTLIAPRLLRRLARGSVPVLRRLGQVAAFALKAITKIKLPKRAPREEPILLKLHEPGPQMQEAIPIHHTPHAASPGLRVLKIDDQATTETLPDVQMPINYELPPLSLLCDPDPHPVADKEALLRDRAALLEKTFHDFGLSVKVVGIHTGPVITQYEIALETGLRLNKVTTLSDDIALSLKVPAVRIVAPLPGRNTVGIEVPNEHRQSVRLKELIIGTQAKAAKFRLPVFIGKDVEGRALVYDLAAMPHLLIAGRTGTGKSVCLNAIILSLLYSRTPDECRLIMIDRRWSNSASTARSRT